MQKQRYALVKREYRVPFILVTSLFFLWGFAHAILDVLNKHFQDVLVISRTHSAWVQVMFYLGYFVMAIPAGLFINKYGYRRGVLKLPAALAPVKLAVMPLVKKDGLPEKAREVIDSLKFHFHCQYDEKDSIGKRYRRQDAIGTPYCVTVDHQTLEDNCVTLRNRDTMQQERVAISELNNIIADRVSITSLLKTLQ